MRPVKKLIKKTGKPAQYRKTVDFDVPDDLGPRRRHVDVGSVDEELHVALRAKLVSLAAKPVTPRTLLELEQMTRVARQLIATEMDPMAMKSPHHHGPSSVGSIDPAPYQGYFAGEGGIPLSVGGASALAPSPPVENFGATIVRELMSLLGATKKPEAYAIPAPTETEKLMDDIASARAKGLNDIADTLMKKFVKLTMADKPTTPSTPPSTPPPDWPPGYKPEKLKKTTNGAKA